MKPHKTNTTTLLYRQVSKCDITECCKQFNQKMKEISLFKINTAVIITCWIAAIAIFKIHKVVVF